MDHSVGASCWTSGKPFFLAETSYQWRKKGEKSLSLEVFKTQLEIDHLTHGFSSMGTGTSPGTELLSSLRTVSVLTVSNFTQIHPLGK